MVLCLLLMDLSRRAPCNTQSSPCVGHEVALCTDTDASLQQGHAGSRGAVCATWGGAAAMVLHSRLTEKIPD